MSYDIWAVAWDPETKDGAFVGIKGEMFGCKFLHRDELDEENLPKVRCVWSVDAFLKKNEYLGFDMRPSADYIAFKLLRGFLRSKGLRLLCVICGAPVPEERSKRKGITCSDEHSAELNNRRRNQKSGTSCRLCGRRIRKPRTETVLTEQGAIESRPCAEGAQIGS